MNKRFVLLVSLALVALIPAAPSGANVDSHPARPAVTIPFELILRHIFLRVRANNSRPLSFALDTGDKVGIIDLDRARELGLNLQGQIRVGGGGSETLTGFFAKGATWTLPGLEGFSQPISLALPLGALAAKLGHDLDGIIGSDFISQFVVEIDYQSRLIRLFDKATFTYSGPGESIPIQLNQQGHPTIEAEVTSIGGPVHGRFVLDLGSGGALALHSPFVAEHHLLDSGQKTIRLIGAGGAGGKLTGRVGRVPELKIGKFRIANPITILSEDKAGAFASSALAGNIGQRLAERFRIFLDYSQNRIILEPAANFGEPLDGIDAGFALVTEGKDYTPFRVTEVLENSPASEAGLKEDDIITGVDGRPASELTLTRLTEIFELPVARKLTVRRGDQIVRLTITPRRLV